MFNAFRRALRRLTPAEVAARELADAELSLLTAQSGMEWAKSNIDYHETRIKRLRKFLANMDKSHDDAKTS